MSCKQFLPPLLIFALHSFVVSRLDYYNSVLWTTSVWVTLWHPLTAIYAEYWGSCFSSLANPSDVRPVPRDRPVPRYKLHWLPIGRKITLIVYKYISGLALLYLDVHAHGIDLYQKKITSTRQLCHSQLENLYKSWVEAISNCVLTTTASYFKWENTVFLGKRSGMSFCPNLSISTQVMNDLIY